MGNYSAAVMPKHAGVSAQQEDKETLGLFLARMKSWNRAGAGGGQPSLGKSVLYRASASSNRQQSSRPGKI